MINLPQDSGQLRDGVSVSQNQSSNFSHAIETRIQNLFGGVPEESDFVGGEQAVLQRPEQVDRELVEHREAQRMLLVNSRVFDPLRQSEISGQQAALRAVLKYERLGRPRPTAAPAVLLEFFRLDLVEQQHSQQVSVLLRRHLRIMLRAEGQSELYDAPTFGFVLLFQRVPHCMPGCRYILRV